MEPAPSHGFLNVESLRNHMMKPLLKGSKAYREGWKLIPNPGEPMVHNGRTLPAHGGSMAHR